MSNAIETLQLVVALAERLPGISVRGSEIRDADALIHTTANGAEAINSIQHLAMSANVGVEPWLRHPLPGARAEQTLVAHLSRRDTLEFGGLQILGIHIVWRLHKLGLMAASEANPLLRAWRAVEVGA